MTLPAEIRDLYLTPASMTAIPRALDLPRGVAAAFALVQGVMLHQFWAGAYGETLTPERIAQVHLRPSAAILDHLAASGADPLAPRPPSRRIVGVCRHFSTLATALLRGQGVPARARCGFATYFDGAPVDHWVVEYWDAAAGWRLGDPQMDAVQAQALELAFDPFDVPRDRFLVAGEAWRRCRADEADPNHFGILDMHGLWFVAGNLVRDLAALNNMEMLPWDVWGLMFQPGATPGEATLAKLDRVAGLTLDPDSHFDELRALYRDDPELRTPAQVFNALTQRMEAAASLQPA
jgi:hypothetical protein